MSASESIAVGDVLPHKPPMILLDRVLDHQSGETTCLVRVDCASPFAAADGTIRSWVALEYMGQCAAAHSGLLERGKGLPIRMGFLLGSRRTVFHVASFRDGMELEVRARTQWDDGELANFECTVRDRSDGRLLVEGELSAYSPRRLDDLVERQPS